MITVILKPKKEESLLRFHPWVFSGAIQKIILPHHYPHSEPKEGEVVVVRSSEGRVLGIGHFQVGSIAVRMLAFGTDTLPSDFWLQRLKTAYNVRLAAGLITEQNTMWRWVHGEGDLLPGLVVDVYGKTAVMQAHSVGMHCSRFEIAKALTDCHIGIENVYYKSDDTLPFKAQLEGDKTGWLVGNENGQHWAKENGLEFGIDFEGGQKTGFFLDQRDNRALLEHYAQGKDVLNMFCYTGGFSVYALRGGARLVHSVDVSERAVERVRANVERNFPSDKRHEAFAQEAFRYMADIQDRYDLIVLDPPAFAKHQDARRNALRGYQRLNAKALQQIRKGGLLFTFSCSQAIDKDSFRLAVFSAAAETKRQVRILHQLHQGADHPINIYHPEGEYLKGLVLYVE
ncbi:MAG: class I SAM-dependent rRNA methyltransferase [Paludibacteraceae bacterium]|nr:class I SAM-dependent rRNA methyltransferase [Paludibacteraceae bacterium]